MAGLDRKVLNSRRITKRVAPSNPVFSRSFITSFGVASHSRERNNVYKHGSAPFSFSSKKRWGFWPFAGKGVHLHRKQPITNQDNEGLFI